MSLTVWLSHNQCQMIQPGRAGESKTLEIATLPVRNEADLYTAIGLGHLLADRVGLKSVEQLELEAILIELTFGALGYTAGCVLTLRCLERDDPPAPSRRGLEIIVDYGDLKPADVARILLEGYGPTSGTNLGALSRQRLADDFAVDHHTGGLRVRTCKWLGPDSAGAAPSAVM